MVPGVVGSNPITHPRRIRRRAGAIGFGSVLFTPGYEVKLGGKVRYFDFLTYWFESSHPCYF